MSLKHIIFIVCALICLQATCPASATTWRRLDLSYFSPLVVYDLPRNYGYVFSSDFIKRLDLITGSTSARPELPPSSGVRSFRPLTSVFSISLVATTLITNAVTSGGMVLKNEIAPVVTDTGFVFFFGSAPAYVNLFVLYRISPSGNLSSIDVMTNKCVRAPHRHRGPIID
jgi:hypothetical protein